MRMGRRTWARGATILAVAGGLAAATVMTPVIAAGPVTKKTVKKTAGKLDRRIGGRVGYAFDSTSNRLLDPGATDAPIEQLTTSVTAPAPGFLVLDLWMDSKNEFTSDYWTCYFRVDGTKVQSSELVVLTDAGADDETNCSTHAVVPVSGGAHSVALVTDDVSYDVTVTDEIGLSAMYVPFDGAGARPTDFTVAKGE